MYKVLWDNAIADDVLVGKLLCVANESELAKNRLIFLTGESIVN